MATAATHPEGVALRPSRWWAPTPNKRTNLLRFRNARRNIDRALVILGLWGPDRPLSCPHCGPAPKHVRRFHGHRQSWLWCIKCKGRWTPFQLLGMFGYMPEEVVEALH